VRANFIGTEHFGQAGRAGKPGMRGIVFAAGIRFSAVAGGSATGLSAIDAWREPLSMMAKMYVNKRMVVECQTTQKQPIPYFFFGCGCCCCWATCCWGIAGGGGTMRARRSNSSAWAIVSLANLSSSLALV
jgi:streptolysin S family bacteriocin protoxin